MAPTHGDIGRQVSYSQGPYAAAELLSSVAFSASAVAYQVTNTGPA